MRLTLGLAETLIDNLSSMVQCICDRLALIIETGGNSKTEKSESKTVPLSYELKYHETRTE
jgi:hypothetical protein